MKHASDLINRKQGPTSLQTTSNTSGRTATNFDSEKINLIFHTMSGYYGHLFTSQYKSADALKSAKIFWYEKLSAKSPEQIRAALHRMATEHKKNPPSLPEFLDLFKFTREQALNAGQINADPAQQQLPKPGAKKYALGQSPAALAANKIVSDKVNRNEKTIKIMNDLEYENYLNDLVTP